MWQGGVKLSAKRSNQLAAGSFCRLKEKHGRCFLWLIALKYWLRMRSLLQWWGLQTKTYFGRLKVPAKNVRKFWGAKTVFFPSWNVKCSFYYSWNVKWPFYFPWNVISTPPPAPFTSLKNEGMSGKMSPQSSLDFSRLSPCFRSLYCLPALPSLNAWNRLAWNRCQHSTYATIGFLPLRHVQTFL